MEKEKLITLIEMLEREIQEICDLPRVGHRAIGAVSLIQHIKWAVCDEKTIDLEKIRDMLDTFKEIKNRSEKEIIKFIQNMDSETLNQLAFIKAAEVSLQSQNDEEEISAEDFKQLIEYELFLMKEGLIGKTIQTVEHNGCRAKQFQNHKVLISDDNGKGAVCSYYKKATKDELIRLINQYKSK